jgi:HEAT repeat protein
LATSNWSGAVQPINGLGRLGARRAAPLILQAWHVSEYSSLRPRALEALLALAPSQATPLAEEGLWDCEELARQRSAQVASLTDSTRPRLEALSEDELECEDVRASAAARLR